MWFLGHSIVKPNVAGERKGTNQTHKNNSFSSVTRLSAGQLKKCGSFHLVHVSALVLLFHIKPNNCTYLLVTLHHSDMFQPSKGWNMSEWCHNIILCLFVQLRTAALRLIVRSWLDVPTFATRRLHACHHARAPSSGRCNSGQEMSGNFA